ncbi:hypothetical protein [Hirschia litorea]|uniref:Uncharacterized protein n=1 Tax=Hirschia litorea TaxID=1199156 RepID=A0ABW2IJ34_9PROT
MMKNFSPSSAIKSLILATSLCATSFTAFAGPSSQDARMLNIIATDLILAAKDAEARAQAYPSLDAPEISQDFVDYMQRFGLSASRLSNLMERVNGPVDMQCIFRGMAKETGDQLFAISQAKTGYEQAQALNRIVSMLDDAALVSKAAEQTLANGTTPITNKTVIGSCPAE